MVLDLSYDNFFITLPKLNWLPWVGRNYNKTKVLLLAESHYEDNDGWLIYRNATRAFVNNQGLNSQNPDFIHRRLFNQIEKTLLNRETSTIMERKALWNNVAFFNLVQRLLASRNQRPSEQDYDEGWINFLEVAALLKPKICIKYGYEGIGRLGYLLNNFDTGWVRDNVQEFYKKPYCINISNGNHKMRIIFTHHPTGSFGFDYTKWADHIKQNFPQVNLLFVPSQEKNNNCFIQDFHN